MGAQLFYQLLVGEMQVRSGEPGTGYSLVLDAARKTQHEELYRRAVEIALQGRSGDAALAAARAWASAHPQSVEAHKQVLQILMALNRPGEMGATLSALWQHTPAPQRLAFLQSLPQTMARLGNKTAVLDMATQALQPALADPASAPTARVTLGRLQLANNQPDDALATAQRAQAADPTLAYTAWLGLELLEKGVAGAQTLVERYLTAAGGQASAAVRLGYARLLMDTQQVAQARAQLEAVTATQPDQADAWLLLGLLHTQARQNAPARAALERYLALTAPEAGAPPARGRTQAHLQLALLAERERDYAAANAWLDRVENADDMVAVQARRAGLLAKQGRLADARRLLQQLPERQPADVRRKGLAEAQLLRDAGAHTDALVVHQQLAARFPDDPDLQYEHAMAADRAGKPGEMEAVLRRLMAQTPNNANAYNALGYALADRNERLDEARALIAKAVSLAPDDAYIQDSLGWVEFRLGRHAEALRILQSAYLKRPDAEIAAHLGEVLHVTGERDKAKRIWQEGLLLNAENPTLLDTLKRFKVQP
jgi:tetratricopeptide (TPR) repeat protein